jgi:ABC-2 type transport system ATP-binding protein
MIAQLREIPEDKQLELISDAVINTGLQDYLLRPISQLSKGYRQRVGLAQAILHKPKVLILDEPTSGLDPSQIVEIRHLIQNLAKDATILLSTHILSEVELTCERVLIIMKGELQTDASLSELKAVNAALLSVENKADNVENTLKNIKGVNKVSAVDDYSTNNGYKTYQIQGDIDDLCPAIYKIVKEQGWNIAELRPDRKTLEKVFNSLAARSGGES